MCGRWRSHRSPAILAVSRRNDCTSASGIDLITQGIAAFRARPAWPPKNGVSGKWTAVDQNRLVMEGNALGLLDHCAISRMLEAQRFEPALLMENFKREHFQAEYPDQTFPAIELIAERDAEFLRNEWSRKLNVEPE